MNVVVSFIHPYHANQSFMRSHNKLLLCEIRSNRSWGKSVAAPTLWNSLPEHVKYSPSLASFKSSLKTHLMKIALTFHYWNFFFFTFLLFFSV